MAIKDPLARAILLCCAPIGSLIAESAYLGRAACQPCHPAQFQKHSATGHAKSLQVAAAGSPGYWAFGAGLKAVTYVSQADPDHYIEHGLSYYPSRKALGVTPGHKDSTGRKYRTLDPTATALRCFRCHSTGPIRTAGGEIQVTEQGVQCESCHGPGGDHAQAKGAAGTIFNPRRLSATQMNSYCGSCHRKAEDISDWSNAWNVRHEPAYLNQSACFRKSEGKLSCLTCHDAHAPLNQTAASYDPRCASCHQKVNHRTKVVGSCSGCHMPRVQTEAKLEFTNHWIGVYEKGRPLFPIRGVTGAPLNNEAPSAVLSPADPSSLRPVFEQALADAEPDQLKVARRSSDLGLFLRSIGDLEGSASALRKTLKISVAARSSELPADQENYGLVLASLQRQGEAASLLLQAAEGSNASVSARSWSALASLDTVNMQAHYKRALEAEERASGKQHPRVAIVLNNLALTYRQANDNQAAEPLLRRAMAIQQKSLGAAHPAVATTMNNLGSLLQSSGRLGEAERLEREALRILQQRLGPQTAEMATAYTNLADLLWTKGSKAESASLYRKALAVDDFIYGPEHLEVAGDLTNLGSLLKEVGQTKEAVALLQRALAIFEHQLGPSSPQAVQARDNLRSIR